VKKWKPKTPAAPTQLSQGYALRREIKALYPQLAALRERLSKLLDESQNPPPDGHSDGSMTETQFNQLRSIERKLADFLLAALFDTR
jgi:hypothetical protein